MVGLIDGIADATASITKVFTGYLSDRTGKRKPLILIGYGLGRYPSHCSRWPEPRR
jgi:MFS family permease